MKRIALFTVLLGLIGCATQPASTPPLVPAVLLNPPPKPVHIPADPLDSLSAAERAAYLHGQRGPIHDGFTWEFGFDPHATETVYCSPMHVTEIILGEGERIANSAIGDSDRWEVNASGNHILIKPTPPGHNQGASYPAGMTVMPPVVYSTNLIAESDKHTYHFILQSTAHRWMEQVTFFYPDDITAARAARAQAMREAARQTAAALATDSLNFNYRISGANVPWRPVQVFSDRSHTYIQFSDTAAFDGDMPALFAGDPEHAAMVNYETRGNAFIADRVLTQAALTEGAGVDRQVVRIEETR
jgi:type IV secretion system protein TrbG